MNIKHNVWSLVDFEEELNYIDNVSLVFQNEIIKLSEYIERIYDNMNYKVSNGLGCCLDANLNDMGNIIAMVNGNTEAIDHFPFVGCKFVFGMNSEEVNLVRFADDKINDILGYVAAVFIRDFCKKADIVSLNQSKHEASMHQFSEISFLLNRVLDDRIINFNKVLDFAEEIKSNIVKKYFEDDRVDIHKLSTTQLSIITKIPIKDIQDAARSGNLPGYKEGRKWYFDFDKIFVYISGGSTNNEAE